MNIKNAKTSSAAGHHIYWCTALCYNVEIAMPWKYCRGRGVSFWAVKLIVMYLLYRDIKILNSIL